MLNREYLALWADLLRGIRMVSKSEFLSIEYGQSFQISCKTPNMTHILLMWVKIRAGF